MLSISLHRTRGSHRGEFVAITSSKINEMVLTPIALRDP